MLIDNKYTIREMQGDATARLVGNVPRNGPKWYGGKAKISSQEAHLSTAISGTLQEAAM